MVVVWMNACRVACVHLAASPADVASRRIELARAALGLVFTRCDRLGTRPVMLLILWIVLRQTERGNHKKRNASHNVN
jgi:hypothetical protein